MSREETHRPKTPQNNSKLKIEKNHIPEAFAPSNLLMFEFESNRNEQRCNRTEVILKDLNYYRREQHMFVHLK